MRSLLLIIFICISRLFSGQDYFAVSSKSFFEKGFANDTAKLDSLDISLLHAAVFHATNLERSKKRQFKYDIKLEKGALFHSGEMRTNFFFSHTNRKNKKYKTPFHRAKKFNANYVAVGENILDEIALNYKDNSMYDAKKSGDKYVFYYHSTGKKIEELTYEVLAKKIVNSWMHSPGHRANILDKSYTHLGIGAVLASAPYANDKLPSLLVTQLFGGN